MLDLEYQNSENGWPVTATSGDLSFSFSGVFSRQRIQKEQLAKAINLFSKGLLFTLLLAGAFAFAYNAYLSLPQKDFLFFLNHSFYNLLFYVGCFSACFLWAKTKQEKINRDSLNLLSLEEHAKQKNIDIYSLFSQDAKKVWTRAFTVATEKNGQKSEVTALDLFLGLTEDNSVRLLFMRLGVNAADLQTFIKNYRDLHLPGAEQELSQLPFAAFLESLKLHNRQLDPLMLLCALAIILPPKHIIQAIFFNINLDIEKLEIVASWTFNLKMLGEDYTLFKKLSKFKPDSEINRGLTSLPTRYLDRFSQDLTRHAKHGALPLALGRAADLNEIFKIAAESKTNIVIRGAEGSGRSTVINELAYKMASEQVPPAWQDKRLVKLELSAIVGSGQKAEETLIQILDEAETAGNIILVLEEIHTLAKTGGSSGLNLLEILINFLEGHNLLVIGTTTLEDYTDSLETSANFESTFTTYELLKLSKTNILLACCIRASLLEGKNKCFFTYQAIEQAVDLSDLYIHGVSQPQKAIGILVEAASAAKNSKSQVVTEELVQTIISKKTHIPTHNFSQDEAEKLLNLESEMGKYVIGQTAAVTAVAEGLRRARSGLTEATRPLASFLFLGPTGVGKTEIAKTLARLYFGEEKYLLRLDMSEYRGNAGIDKLLGNEGDRTDTALIKHIKNYPFCLLLVDEFEKASSEIVNLFLQILEDGRLTTGRGETLDLTHCLIIATSNAGTADIQTGLQARKTLEQIKQELFNKALTSIFPPELLNRFDGIILFSPLSAEEVEQITFLQLQYLTAKLKDKGVKIEFSPAVIKDISQKAFDPLLGARPIRRYIQDHVEGFIAKLLLAKKFERGTTAMVDMENGELILR